MGKLLKKIQAEKKHLPEETMRKVWLASLGALSILQKQAESVLEGMISEGQSFQARSRKFGRSLGGGLRKAVDQRVAPLLARVTTLRDEVESRFEQGVGRALSYAGIPSKADVDALIARVDKLSRQLRAAK